MSKENNVAQSQIQRASVAGNYLGQPIYQTIESRSGTYVLDRIAEELDGEFPLEQLLEAAVLLRRGLIYRPQA